MLRGLRKRLTFANAMSVTALFIALGGTAIAVGVKLPKDSVGAKQIKAGAVRSSEVKDGSLQSVDFANGVLLSGSRGEQGPKGEKGETGPPGEAATKLFAFVRVGNCCGGALPQLDPPLVLNGHGIKSAADGGTGEYEVTVDESLLPGGQITNCVPIVSLGSADAAFPLKGEISVGHPNGIPANKLLVLYRDSAGNLAELNNGGGSVGFGIAIFC